MSVIKKLLVSTVLVIVGGVGFIYSGLFNVSALWEDPALLRWALVSTREASVETRAENIESPPLGGATQIANGFRSYREMCAVCHTPPGGTDSPIKQGLNPSPPDLSEEEDHAMSNAQLFWVIKNGIRMTGMPAWGPTHDDAEIWDIVAFVKALPKIDAAEYQRLDMQTTKGHGHSGSGAQSKNEQHMDKPTASHGMEKGHSNSPQEAPNGHDVRAAPSHAETTHQEAPREYIDNGTHAH